MTATAAIQRIGNWTPVGYSSPVRAYSFRPPDARLLLQNKRVGHGKPTFEGAVTVGFPWPAKE